MFFLPQLTHYNVNNEQEEVFIRGCATNCIPSVAFTEDAFEATTCCKGDLCNTDVQGELIDMLTLG